MLLTIRDGEIYGSPSLNGDLKRIFWLVCWCDVAYSQQSASPARRQRRCVPFQDAVDVQGVIAEGAEALASVTTAELKSARAARKRDVNIDSVRLADGEKAALSAAQNARGPGHLGAMTASEHKDGRMGMAFLPPVTTA